MAKKRTTVLVILIAIVANCVQNLNSGELATTQWPSFRHDTFNSGRSLYRGIATQPGIQWKVSGMSFLEASPIVGPDGTIYCGSEDHNFYAIGRTGNVKWTYPTGSFIRSTAAIALDGTIYFGAYDRNLYALTEKGGLKWTFTVGGGIGGPPTIGPDGTIYVGCVDNHLYAISPEGLLEWRFEAKDWITFSAPAIAADGTIYVGSHDRNLYAINPSGTKKWEFLTGAPVRTSPSIASDGTIYFGSRDGNLYAVYPDGSERWRYPTGSEVRSSTALAADGTVYFGSWDNNLYALNPDGSLKWTFLTEGPIEASPCVDVDGVIYVSCLGGGYYAINPNGTERWLAAKAVFHSSPVIGSNGTVYGTLDYSFLALGHPFPEIVVILNKTQFTTGETIQAMVTLTNPAIVEQRAEVKVWLVDADGMVKKLQKVNYSVLPGGFNTSQMIYKQTFSGSEKKGRYTIGAKVLVPTTGETYSESQKQFVFSP